MARLRVGVIGCGNIAQIMHLPYLRQLGEAYELVALCDISRRLVDSVAERFGVERRFTDYRQLLDLELEAVLVLSSGSHAEPALAALASGKHVLVEKPLCFTLAEADRLIEAAASSRRTLMVGYMKRYDPGFRFGERVLPDLGELRYVQINTLHPREAPYLEIHSLLRNGDVPPEQLQRLRADRERLAREAVGPVSETLSRVYTDILLGSLIHDINALRALVGEPLSVDFTGLWPPDDNLPVITTVLRHSERLRSVYSWAYLADLPHYFEEIALMSSAGRLRIQFPSPYLRHFPTPVVVELTRDGALIQQHVTASYAEAFQEQLRHFHHCVTEGEPPLTDAVDARRDIELLQQVLAALAPEGLGGEAAGGPKPGGGA